MLRDSSLDALIPDMLELVLGSSPDSTVRKYSQGWRRWSEWAKSKIGVPTIPAQPLSVALYLTCLVNKAVEQNQSVGPIETAAYSIRCGHRTAGLPYPTDHSTVMAVLEGARRKLAKAVQPKEPLTEAALKTICEHYNTNSASLEVTRFLFLLIIGYSGLFCISEILGIKMSDIVITDSFTSISVPKRKNDQHREGHVSILARSGKLTCPVSITEKLLSLLPFQDPKASLPIIRRIVKTKKQERFHEFLSISYTKCFRYYQKVYRSLCIATY